ncbi:tetratricopeptide repeat protein [Hydrogenivirga sp.]
MSLLIDLLRKFRGESRRTSVHPLIMKGSSKGKPLNRKALFALIPLVGLSAVGGYILVQLLAGGVQPSPPEMRVVNKESVVFREPSGWRKETPRDEKLVAVESVGGKEKQAGANRYKSVHVKEEVKVKEPIRANTREVDPVRKLTEELKPVKEESGVNRSPQMDFTTLLYLADRSFREGNLQKSAELYEKALNLRVTDSVINNLLVIYARLGRFKRAEELLRRHPKEELVYSYLVELSNSGENELALKASERFLPFDRQGYIHFARGYIYERLGEFSAALREFAKAYEKNPGNPYFAYNYARLLEVSGDYRKAYEVYSRLNTSKLEPNLRSIVLQRLRQLELIGF